MSSSSVKKGASFEERVCALLKMIGFVAERDHHVAGGQIDIVARPEESFPGRLTYLVECKNEKKRVGIAVVRTLYSQVEAAEKVFEAPVFGPPVLGWIVSTNDLTPQAKKHAVKQGILFTRYDELFGRNLDLRAYYSRLLHDAPQNTEYIHPMGILGDAEELTLLDDLIGRRLLVANTPIFLVGEPGAGKTFYARWLASSLVKRRRDGDWRSTPILIPLDEVEVSYRHFISAYLRRQGICRELNLERFMGEVGLTLILDGLDTLPVREHTSDRLRGWLREFVKLSKQGNQVLVTCRKAFFSDTVEEKLADVSSRSSPFEIVYLQRFCEEDVKRYLSNSAMRKHSATTERDSSELQGSKWTPSKLAEDTWQLFENHQLQQMLEVPVILKLVARHARMLPYLIQPDDTAAKVLWAVVRYDIEQVSSVLGQAEEDSPQLLRRLAYDSWLASVGIMSREGPPSHRPNIRSNPVVRGMVQDTLEALAYNLWQEGCLGLPVAEVFGVDTHPERLSPSEAALKHLAQGVLLALASGECGSCMDWDDMTVRGLREHTEPGPEITDKLEYSEQESVVLKRHRREVSFAHAIFRDIFAASYLLDKLRTNSAGEIQLGAEMGQYVIELMDNEEQPADEPRHIPDGMAYVPAGPFIAGERHETWVRKTFNGVFFAKHQVTNHEFKEFVEAGGYEDDQWWHPAGLRLRDARNWKGPRSPAQESFEDLKQPVVGITCFEAEAYCAWLSGHSGLTVRLPTSREWEKAARGIDGRRYPWGNEEAFSRAATDEYAAFSKPAVAEPSLGHALDVGHFSPEGDSPYGLADMAGNAWDWVTIDDEKRAVRGGSFAEPLFEARSANCRPMDPRTRSHDIGFRIVQELPDEDVTASE